MRGRREVEVPAVAEFGPFTWQESGRRFGRCVHCHHLAVRLHEDGPVTHNVNGDTECPTGYRALTSAQ